MSGNEEKTTDAGEETLSRKLEIRNSKFETNSNCAEMKKTAEDTLNPSSSFPFFSYSN